MFGGEVVKELNLRQREGEERERGRESEGEREKEIGAGDGEGGWVFEQASPHPDAQPGRLGLALVLPPLLDTLPCCQESC